RIAAQRLQVGQLVEFDAVDGLVAADVQVARADAGRPAGRVGQGGEAARLARGGDVDLGGVLARFLLRLLAPAAGNDEIDPGRAREVERHDGVFRQAAALHEEDLEFGRNGEQAAQPG